MVKCLDFGMFAVYCPHSISQISSLHLEDLFVQDLNEQFGAMATRGQSRPFSVVLKLKLNLLFQKTVCNAGDCSFSPWVGKIPWRREWLPTPVFLPGEFHGRGVWRATVHRIAESDRTEQLTLSLVIFSVGTNRWSQNYQTAHLKHGASVARP